MATRRVLALFLALAAGSNAGCLEFLRISAENRAAFLQREPDGLHTTRLQGRKIRFALSGRVGARPVLFIHGTPGSWDAFALFLNDPELRRQARLISVDRAGFGGSGPGQPVPSIGRQARFCAAVLEAARLRDRAADRRLRASRELAAIVVGHSWGGPIAARLTMDFPREVASLVLVAASVDPELEEIQWYQHAARWRALRWLVPRDLATANAEMFPAERELTAMLHRWKEIHVPVTIIQGGRDSLVPPANAEFAIRRLVNARLRVERYPEVDHLVPWYWPRLIRAAILRELHR